MDKLSFNIFPNVNFIDLCMYQFGHEQPVADIFRHFQHLRAQRIRFLPDVKQSYESTHFLFVCCHGTLPWNRRFRGL